MHQKYLSKRAHSAALVTFADRLNRKCVLLSSQKRMYESQLFALPISKADGQDRPTQPKYILPTDKERMWFDLKEGPDEITDWIETELDRRGVDLNAVLENSEGIADYFFLATELSHNA